MNDTAATMRLFERASASGRRGARSASPEPAMIGMAGMGWSHFFRRARAPRRADQGRRRQARAGRLLSDRPQLRHRCRRRGRTICASRPTRSASTIRRRRPTTPSRRAHASGPTVARREHEPGAADVSPRAPGRSIRPTPKRAGRLLHLHPCLAFADDRHRRLRRGARAARRSLAGFRRRRRRAGDPAARRRSTGFTGCLPAASESATEVS